jgi:hypothetical protein
MVAKLLKRLAGRSSSTSGDGETLVRRNLSVEREDRSGVVAYPLPSAWVKMHVWRRDHGQCVLCGSQERVWFNYIVPPWEGGSVTEQNIRLRCEGCSRRNKGVWLRRKSWELRTALDPPRRQ